MGDATNTGQGFRDLIAWQKARLAVRLVYEWSACFPESERFGLVSQMRRAAVSVPSKIAEGYGMGTQPAFARYLRLARGSLAELQTQVQLAIDLGLASSPEPIEAALAETGRVLQGLIRSVMKSRPDNHAGPST
jgi:four helix bundle protein